MSGGYFNYDQNRIIDIADKVMEIIESFESESLSEPTRKRFVEAVWYLNVAYTYSQRIDWLISGDDSEATFHHRLEDELNELDRVIKEIEDHEPTN